MKRVRLRGLRSAGLAGRRLWQQMIEATCVRAGERKFEGSPAFLGGICDRTQGLGSKGHHPLFEALSKKRVPCFHFVPEPTKSVVARPPLKKTWENVPVVVCMKMVLNNLHNGVEC